MKAVPFNVKYGVYGIISSEDVSTGVPTYADIVEFDPLMNVKWTPNTNSGVLYGEGIPRKSVVKKGSDDLELGVTGITNKHHSDLFGHTYTPASSGSGTETKETLVTANTDKIPYNGIGFCVENDDGSLTAYWYYKGRLEEPGGDVSQTEDGKITFSTPTMKGSYVYGSDGVQRKVVEIPTDSGSVDYETIMGLTVTP